ncbi:MAG: hypothetical protein AAFP97_12910, partial [Pseudomonadota bacterium]
MRADAGELRRQPGLVPGATPLSASIKFSDRSKVGSAAFKNDALHGTNSGVSVPRIFLIALGFLILAMVIFSIKTFVDYTRYNAQAEEAFRSDLQAQAQSVSKAIDAQSALMNLALSVTRDPSILAPLTRQSEIVRGVAVLTAQGRILAETDQFGAALTQIDLNNISDGQLQVASLIQPETGETTPVILQRAGELYLLAALRPSSLIGQGSPDSALVWSNGRLIDAAPAIGKVGAYPYYELTPARMNNFAQLNQTAIFRTEYLERPVWLGATPIPKSNGSMLILDRRDRSMPGFLGQNIFLFGLLFAGLIWVGWMLSKQFLTQMNALKARSVEDEIARQRHQAAVEGSGGGVWEIDLTRNMAFVSESLAKLMEIGNEDKLITMSEFLCLFEASDRDHLYNTIRRTQVGGSFDMELSVANSNLVVACRGVPSMRGHDQAKVIIGMAIDVTDTHMTQNRLQAAEAR